MIEHRYITREIRTRIAIASFLALALLRMSQLDLGAASRTISLSAGNTGGGYTPAAHSTDWADVTSTPTTLIGYGITDAASDSELAAPPHPRQALG